jgi:TolB protein
MTPIGADLLPVEVSVEGEREFARPALDQLVLDIDFSGLLETSSAADASIEARVETAGSRLRLSAEVQAGGEVLLARDYLAAPGDLYTMVHALADDAVYALTGERGIAGTRIAFVTRSGTTYSLAARGFDPRGPAVMLRDTSVITTPAWSPDGSTVAFTSFRTDNGDLYFYTLADSRARPVLTRQGLNTTPCWAPDGSALALSSSADGNAEIFLMDSADRTLTRLTSRSSIETSPSISPTGMQMVFTSDRSGAPQLYLMDLTGAGVERMNYSHAYCDSPAWSPRGDMIAYAARSGGGIHIFVMNADGSEVRQVTSEGSLNEDPVWGPTGRHLAFSSDRAGSRSIYVLELNSLVTRRLTDSGECYCPTWSPLGAATASE